MDEIIKGTTPTIVYSFSKISVSDIVEAILTVKKNGTVVIEKDLESASVGEDSLSWTLTQAESLSVSNSAEIMINWKLGDGTRGASKPKNVNFTPNHKEEVI